MKVKFSFKSMLILATAMLTFTSCKDDDGPVVEYDPTTVTTNDATDIAHTTATLSGSFTLTDKPNAAIAEAGFKYLSTSSADLTWLEVEGTVSGTTFTANLTALEANTQYVFYAYISETGSTEEIKGDEITFTTSETPRDAGVTAPVDGNYAPTIGITTVRLWYDIDRGNKGDSYETITEVGFHYWTEGNAGIETEWEKASKALVIEDGAYPLIQYIDVTGLEPSTTYYYLPYILAKDGEVRGDDSQIRTFSTNGTIPSGVEITLGGYAPPPFSYSQSTGWISDAKFTMPSTVSLSDIDRVVIQYQLTEGGAISEHSGLTANADGTITQETGLYIVRQWQTGGAYSFKLIMYFTKDSGFLPAESNAITGNVQ